MDDTGDGARPPLVRWAARSDAGVGRGWRAYLQPACPGRPKMTTRRILASAPTALLDMNLRGVRATPVALAAGGVPFATVTAYPGLPEAVFDGVPLVAKPFTPERVGDALMGLARR